jgi:hypothetical protein
MLQIIKSLELTLRSQEQTIALLRKEWDNEAYELKRAQNRELETKKHDCKRWQSEFARGFQEERNDQAK